MVKVRHETVQRTGGTLSQRNRPFVSIFVERTGDVLSTRKGGWKSVRLLTTVRLGRHWVKRVYIITGSSRPQRLSSQTTFLLTYCTSAMTATEWVLGDGQQSGRLVVTLRLSGLESGGYDTGK